MDNENVFHTPFISADKPAPSRLNNQTHEPNPSHLMEKPMDIFAENPLQQNSPSMPPGARKPSSGNPLENEIIPLTKPDLPPSLKRNFYRFRRKVIKFFGGSYDLYDQNDKKVLYSHQKEFKLKEDFRLYADDSKTDELFKITTGDIFDFHATFHVDDSKTKERIGSIKREWLQSIVRDEWTFLAPDGKTTIGKLQEKTPKRAFFTRLLGPLLVPQIYSITAPDGTQVAEIKQHRNPFVLKYDMNILSDPSPIDRRLLISSGILLTGIEGRQESWSPAPHSSASFDMSTSSA